MRGVNKAILIGHLGRDPEVRYLDGNNVVANFTLATTESYVNREGNRVDNTEWHNIVVWRKLAEIAEKYLKKGSLVYLEGKITTRSWEDKEGNKRYTTEIVASNFQMLDKKSDGGDTSNYNSGTPSTATTNKDEDTNSVPLEIENTGNVNVEESIDDDLPF